MLGFLLIDKPRGITSFRIVQVLRKLLQIRRIGFAGTLDPLATGLMILAVGEATKLLPYLEKEDKVYEVKIRLGAASTSYDAMGEITATLDAPQPPLESIETVLRGEFLGDRMQTPPVFSAIKVQGKRSYDLARKGIEVRLKARPVHFFDISILSYDWPFLSLSVHCSSGTYIRSLAHDLGQRFRCGGYVEELRRTNIAAHDVRDAFLFDAVTAENVQSLLVAPEIFLAEFPRIFLTPEEYTTVRHGGFIDATKHRIERHDGPILALFEGKCVGILEFTHHFEKLKFCKKFNII